VRAVNDGRFITDGGLETTLVFHHGMELPHFAAFVLLERLDGVEALRSYYRPYLEIARKRGVGIILDTPTWRANGDWGTRLGYNRDALRDLNARAVMLLRELREGFDGETPFLVSGCIGPRGDGYVAGEMMSRDEAERYHAEQVETLADAGADLVTALTITYADEAIGIARAARARTVAAVISFTVETDGRLPSGQPLGEAVEQVDAETEGSAAHFMINCAHPTHFAHVLDGAGAWTDRVRGIRANASRKSHAELDEATELDEGNPAELAEEYSEIASRLRNLRVVGGCCGTDHRHVAALSRTWNAH
jgi:S-methylmethionine-dependent homocysteine/selenocysteine methylase